MNITKPDGYFIGMILVNLALAVLIGFTIEYITDSAVPREYALLAGFLVWIVVLFGMGGANSFFAPIPFMHGAIFINPLKAEKSPETPEAAIDLTKPPRSIRQRMWGLLGKWPWEKIEIVDLTRHTILDVSVEVYTKDGITLVAEWTATLSYLSTHLFNARRWSTKAQTQYFTGEFVEKLREVVSQLLEIDIMDGANASSTVQAIRNQFTNMFGGEDKVHETECARGMYTNKPQLISIKRTAAYQKACEAGQISQRLAAGIASLKEKTEDAATASAIAAGIQGIENVKVYHVRGDITGLEELKTLVLPTTK